MSGIYLPVTPTAFAEAIKELPLSVVYAKAAEIQNSISHLQRSNNELRAFIQDACESEQDKTELEGYIAENEGVVNSMIARIQLLKTEVENRGQIWIEEEHRIEDPNANGAQEGEQIASTTVNGAGSGSDGVTEEGGDAARRARPNDMTGTGTAEESRGANEEGEDRGVFL